MRGCWELGGTLTMETGRPITVVSGRDNSLSGVNFDRPDVNGSPQLPTDRSRGVETRLDALFCARAPGIETSLDAADTSVCATGGRAIPKAAALYCPHDPVRAL